jgi:hypothetical protein
MASEQWLLNQAFVSNNAYWNAVTGGSYKLQNTIGATANRVTSSPTPYEGAGCYASGTGNEDGMRFRSSASADLTGTSGTYYFDSYVYLPTGFTDLVAPILTGNDAAVEYTWVQPNADTSLSFGGYDNVNGIILANTTATGKFNTNAWFRVQAKTNQYGMNEFRVFVGGSIDGASPSTTVTPVDFGATYGHSTYQRLYGMVGNGSTYPIYLDNIKFDDAAYPTRSTAHTAAATGTGTATGTAAMSNARTLQATATGTATGTAAASNLRVLASSAIATATGTGAISVTQAISASGSVTATGTAAADVTSVVTVDASATVTASGTASMSSTQAMSASATITATGTAVGSIRPLVTVDGAGTITATGLTTFNKSQALAASASATASATASLIAITTIAATASVTATATATLLITTPGSLYGNAAKVAGLYGSSTKPTLTTRS